MGIQEKLSDAQKYFAIIEKLIKEGYTGSVQLNMFQGGITNLNKNESIKLK